MEKITSGLVAPFQGSSSVREPDSESKVVGVYRRAVKPDIDLAKWSEPETPELDPETKRLVEDAARRVSENPALVAAEAKRQQRFEAAYRNNPPDEYKLEEVDDLDSK